MTNEELNTELYKKLFPGDIVPIEFKSYFDSLNL